MSLQRTLEGGFVPDLLPSRCGHRSDAPARYACDSGTRTHPNFRRSFQVRDGEDVLLVDCSDGHDYCPCCGSDVCDEPQLKDRNATYEEPGLCVPCIMGRDGLSTEEIAGLLM